MTLMALPLLQMNLEGKTFEFPDFPAPDKHVKLYIRISGVHTLHHNSKLLFDVKAVKSIRTWYAASAVQRIDVMADGTEQSVSFDGGVMYMKKYVYA